MGIKESAKSVQRKLRLDSHHAIERFGVIFAAISAAFALIFVGASGSSISRQHEVLDSTVLYTPSFSTSKTQVSGEVSGVYVNSDRTRAMVLMHFDDTSSMSASAAKYQGFLTGSDKSLGQHPLRNEVHGHIVVFGTTGYLAMVLDSSSRFPQQILDLTLRANSELVYTPAQQRSLRSDLAGQKSFSEYDQWRLYFNPGASGAKIATSLDDHGLNPGAIYNQLVIAGEEKTLRSTMDDQLAKLQVDLARIAEYSSEAKTVTAGGIYLQLPTVPEQVAGDQVTGSAGVDGKASTLALKTSWVSPAGFDFDWRDGSVSKGYLDELVPAGQNYVTWLADKAGLDKDSGNASLQFGQAQWSLSNGRLLSDYDTDDEAMQPLFQIRNNLAQAYQDYYTDKLAYQVGSYTQLLNLEVELRGVRSSASTNSTAKALFTY